MGGSRREKSCFLLPLLLSVPSCLQTVSLGPTFLESPQSRSRTPASSGTRPDPGDPAPRSSPNPPGAPHRASPAPPQSPGSGRRPGGERGPRPLHRGHGRTRPVDQPPRGGHLRHLPRLLHGPSDDRLRPQLLPRGSGAAGASPRPVRSPRVPGQSRSRRGTCDPTARSPRWPRWRGACTRRLRFRRSVRAAHREPLAAFCGDELRFRAPASVQGSTGAPCAPAAGRGRRP